MSPTPVIGYQVTHTWCRACAPELVTLAGHELSATDPGSYVCENCGVLLAPCEHVWSEWHSNSFEDGQYRTCLATGCEAVEQR